MKGKAPKTINGSEDLAAAIEDIRTKGITTLSGMAKALNEREAPRREGKLDAIARCTLTPAEWKRIRVTVSLPDEARSAIENAIGLFRLVRHTTNERLKPQHIKEQLQSVISASRTLIDAVLKIDGATLSALADFRDEVCGGASVTVEHDGGKVGIAQSSKRATLGYFDDLTGRLEQLQQWASGTAACLARESPGATRAAEDNKWFVDQLDAILKKFTEKRVNNSEKGPTEFVKECFKVAENVDDKALRKGAIRTAIGRHVRGRRRA